METLFLILELAALAMVVFWVGRPLVSPSFAGSKDKWWEDELEQMDENDKEAVLNTLNEIEFDYSTGKLADDDYEALKKKYQMMAVALLEEEEGEITSKGIAEEDENKMSSEQEIDKEIEEELKRIKAGRGAN